MDDTTGTNYDESEITPDGVGAGDTLDLKTIDTTPAENNIVFYVKDTDEILRLEPGGDIFVRGALVDNDIEVVDALREFVSETIVSRKQEASQSVWFKRELKSAYDAGQWAATKDDSYYEFEEWYLENQPPKK